MRLGCRREAVALLYPPLGLLYPIQSDTGPLLAYLVVYLPTHALLFEQPDGNSLPVLLLL
jgi:hypothetical protein